MTMGTATGLKVGSGDIEVAQVQFSVISWDAVFVFLPNYLAFQAPNYLSDSRQKRKEAIQILLSSALYCMLDIS